eukprot:405554_1
MTYVRIVYVVLLTAVTIVTCSGHANYTGIIMGPSGPGKSSLINFITNKGTQVAKEGATYHSETLTTTLYGIPEFNLQLIDTPGMQDTTGYTNEEIAELIKSALFEQRLDSISGVVLMFDATQVRIHLATMIDGVIRIFGSQMLQHLVIAFNKNDQIDANEQQSILEHCATTLPPIYAQFKIEPIRIADRVIFIDTKGSFSKYLSVLHSAIVSNFDGKGMNIREYHQKLMDEIERHYQMELEDPNNYRTWIEKIPHSEKKTRTIVVNIKTPYNYKCNCEKICSEFGPFSWDCETFCEKCIGHKNVPTETTEEYIDTWYEDVTKSELKHAHHHLRDKARKTVIDSIRNKVYAALQRRNKTKKEL